MTVGTKSVLFGYHAFWLHPFFVAAGWWKLYGTPLDPRLWFAFFLHDVGYVGSPNMDGVEGQQHPFVGAKIMHFLFDYFLFDSYSDFKWYRLCLYHSRTLCNIYFAPLSKLGYADKLAFMYYPQWLVRVLYFLSGEGQDYFRNDGVTEWAEWYRGAAQANIRTLEKVKI